MKTFSSRPGIERRRKICCASCGANEPVLRFDCGEFRFYRCTGCGLIYQYPQPVFDDLKRRYDEDYFSYEIANEEQFLRLMLLGLEDIRFDAIEKRLRMKRFLDIGCATGLLLAHVRDRGWETEGVELCRASAEYGMRNRGLSIHPGTLEDARFPADHFTFIHFSHLIEHLVDPAAFLKEVSRILMPGGLVVVVTPNVDGLQARMFGSGWRSAIADHLYLFSPRTLGTLLSGAGLRVVAIRTWGGIAAGLAPGWIKNPLDRCAKRLGFGDVMLILAESTRTG